MNNRQAPEIFQIGLDSVAPAGLPPKTDPGFEQAVIAQYALKYAAKGWNAAVVVADGFVRVLAVPQAGIEPKAYLLGLLQHGFIEDALPGLEAMYGMVDDPDICFNFGVALSELGRIEESLAPLNKCLNLDPSYDNAAIAIGVSLSKLERFDIGASPYAIDVCTFSLETRRGLWVAQPPIKPKGISKKKRTIQSVEFRYYTEAEGRFMQMLNKKDDDDQPSILH